VIPAIPWYCFDRQTADFDDVIAKPVRKPAKSKQKGRLYCYSCHQAITDKTHGVERGGSHVHVRTNPHGHSFRFGCYREASGCSGSGPAIFEHSWFSGHSWRISLCAGCGAHLGWLFQGEDRFYGLILNRLVEEEPPSS